MLAERSPAISLGHLDKDVHLPAESKLALMDFIAKELPCWRDRSDRPRTDDSETSLTEYLADHLNSATYRSAEWSHVQFCTEVSDEVQRKRKIDLALKPRAATIFIGGRSYKPFDVLFPIEAKRLPTPKGVRRDEREYVFNGIGTTGGIQRFKLGYHASVHGFAGMIGYVQNQSFEHWLRKVNEWIHDLANAPEEGWSDADALEIHDHDPVNRVLGLTSHHERTNGLSPCELRHLWIKMI